MIKILFVCHGNICRSPMAEFVMKDLVNKSGYKEDFFIASKATSTEELGNGPHYGTRNKLKEEGIPMEPHRATQMDKSDYNSFDYIIGMDSWNYKNIYVLQEVTRKAKYHFYLILQVLHVTLLTHGIQGTLIPPIMMSCRAALLFLNLFLKTTKIPFKAELRKYAA